MQRAERLQLISRLQSDGDQFFPNGLFPTFRVHAVTGITRPDDTIFFSALIAFTLSRLSHFFRKEENEKVERMCKRVVDLYPIYRNKDGLPTYNFWQQTPNKHFPNGRILSRFAYFRLPDDADDTVLVYLTDEFPAHDNEYLHEKLAFHANTNQRTVKNTPTEFQHMRAYTTWFGKNMPAEFDFCVMCNVMVWVVERGLPLNEYDIDTLKFIKKVISESKYWSNPFSVSPEYGKPAILWYHFCRLYALIPLVFKEIREHAIENMRELFEKSTIPAEKIIVGTSMIRLGIKPPHFEVPSDFPNKYYWFRAGMMSTYENKWSRRLAPMPFFHLSFYCEAYIQTLALEFEVLSSNF